MDIISRKHLWDTQFETPQFDDPFDVATNSLGSAFIVGRTRGNLAGQVSLTDGFAARNEISDVPEPSFFYLFSV